MQVAKQLDITMHEGIYVMNGGPQYESAAEIEFFKRIGGDALGKCLPCSDSNANLIYLIKKYFKKGLFK